MGRPFSSQPPKTPRLKIGAGRPEVVGAELRPVKDLGLWSPIEAARRWSRETPPETIRCSTSPCHPRPVQPWWIYENMVMASPNAAAGDTVLVQDEVGYVLGWGVYNPASRLRVRIFSRQPDLAFPLSADYGYEALKRAWNRRQAIPGCLAPVSSEYAWTLGRSAFRLVFSEADFLPGMVVDVFGSGAVFQLGSLASEKVVSGVLRALADYLPWVQRCVIRRNGAVRELEGLEILEHPEVLVKGAGGEWLADSGGWDGQASVILADGTASEADLVQGQKTGLFLDQQFNRRCLKGRVEGFDLLDMHCHQGGWALAGLLYGASSAVAVDASATAVGLAKRAARLAGNQPFGTRLVVEVGDDLEWMAQAVRDQRRFHGVILDPPSLAKSGRHLDGALRMHQSLARRALELLRPGGFLVHCCCSQVVSREALEFAVAKAAAKLGKTLILEERLQQPPDHPLLSGHSESEYLKGGLWRLIP